MLPLLPQPASGWSVHAIELGLGTHHTTNWQDKTWGVKPWEVGLCVAPPQEGYKATLSVRCKIIGAWTNSYTSCLLGDGNPATHGSCGEGVVVKT